VSPAAEEHPGKLNLLAAEIAAGARPEDIVVFLDGDAFPIARSHAGGPQCARRVRSRRRAQGRERHGPLPSPVVLCHSDAGLGAPPWRLVSAVELKVDDPHT